MTQNVIVEFHQAATLEMVGGKGLNLLRLTAAGLAVPPGFIVLTAGYEAFATFNGLDTQLSAAFKALRKGRPLAEISVQIRAAFEHGRFPPDLEQQIAAAYQGLSTISNRRDLPVAVRSSATGEDLVEASFAGQLDTYLNVRGEKELLDAVRRCFGSLWSERAIDYRARQTTIPVAVRLAAIVQQMIFADAAGVAFTADPVSGESNQIVIEAVHGLGEPLVSGLVNPDHIVLDKRTGAVLSYGIAEKKEMLVSTANGTQMIPVPRMKRKTRVLRPRLIHALYGLAQTTEQVYGCPQDLEWCLADGKFYIVQARPITTLPALPVTWEPPGPGRWMHGGGTFEMLTEPISPLFETFLLPVFFRAAVQMLAALRLEGVLPPSPYGVVNGHIYLHMDLRLRPWHLVGVLRDFAMHLSSMDVQQSEQVLYRETVARLQIPAISTLIGEQILARMQSLAEAGIRYWLQITKLVQAIYRREKAFTSFYNRHVRRPGDPEPEIFLRGQKIMPWHAECSTFELARLARKHSQVVAALRTAPEIALGTLANNLAAQEFVSALQAHLDRFGHQQSSFDLALPTLADDPRPVLIAVRAFLDGKESPYARQERMTAERELAVAAALNRISSRNRDKFARFLEAAQHAARIREDALFDVGLAWTQMHRCALELGSRLTSMGVVFQAGDVFWLTFDEIRAVLSERKGLAPSVAERKAHHQVWSRINAPYLLPVGSKPAFWWGWVFPTPELQRHPDAHTLIGLGVSPGKVTAVARVIHSVEDAEKLNPGEILVTHTTTPAWTPVFARAAGLITDLGGPLAHGSIVAREMGIPAVMGTGNATLKIRSGQLVTILGSEGKVVLADIPSRE